MTQVQPRPLRRAVAARVSSALLCQSRLKRPLNLSTDSREARDPLVRLLGREAEILAVKQGQLHDRQRPLSERQRAALLEVVGREIIARAAAEARLIGMGQGGVIGETGRCIVPPRLRRGKPEIVLSASPCLLTKAQALGRPEQGGEFDLQPSTVAIGVIAGMQAELVAAGMDFAEQRATGAASRE